MNFNCTMISYRLSSDHVSKFLNVDDLLKSDDVDKLKEVYGNIFKSLTAYEPEYLNALTHVEEKLYHQLIQLEKEKVKFNNKNQKCRRIGLSILTLGFGSLISICKKKEQANPINELDRAHQIFIQFLAKMKQRGLKKIIHPKSKELKKIEKKRKRNVDDELIRLKSNNRIVSSLKNVGKRLKLSQSHQIAYAHSLELREAFKDSHYIINHGQNLDLMIVNLVARLLEQEFEAHQYRTFEILRHDVAPPYIKNTHAIKWYKQKLSIDGASDHNFRKEIICGDCVLESTTRYESALDFFAKRANIAKSPKFIKNLIRSIIYDYIPNQRVANKLCDDLIKLFSKCPKGGNLYSICVPKGKFKESCYFSKPFGVPLKDQVNLRKKIDSMQAGEDPAGYPQIRVLAHKIRAESGFYVILNSSLTQEQLLKIQDEVKLCIQAALTCYRVQNRLTEVF